MAEIPNVVGGEVITDEWGNLIRSRTVQRYASVAARTAAHPTPVEGDLSYLQDSNTVDVFDGTVWVPLTPVIPNDEVDGSVEVPTMVVFTASYTTVTTVDLTIPAGWGSWKCEAYATFASNVSGSGAGAVRLSIDGTTQQALTWVVTGDQIAPGAVGGRRTGMTTTGSRAVILQGQKVAGAGSVGVNTIYLYARAVRTT